MLWILGLANILFAAKIIWFHWYTTTRWGWFKDDHLKVPKWVGFAFGVAGLFVPITPLALEGMFLGYVIYFGNEWVYQKTGWSPLRDTFVWVKNKAIQLWPALRAKFAGR